MKIAMLLTVAALAPCLACAAGPTNSSDRYDYNMRSSNKDGYVPDTERVTNKDGYIPDTARIGDKVDPYAQGARQNSASALVDETSASPKAHAKSHGHKKTPMTTDK
jgi:hypothetical protein